jgi:hypothetical protein
MITSRAVPVLLPAHHRRVATPRHHQDDFADLWVPKTWSTWADSLVMLRFAGVLKQGLWRSLGHPLCGGHHYGACRRDSAGAGVTACGGRC